MPGIDIYVDVHTPTGLRTGPGPITAVTSWTDTNELNRVGSFRCAMPATDARRSFIEQRGFLKAYTRYKESFELVSVGLVRKERIYTAGKETFVEYSGPSYADELNYRLVHDLELSELQLWRPSMAYWHIPEPEFEEEWNVNLTEDGTNPELQGSLADRNFTNRWYFNRQWYGTTDPDERGFDTGNYFYFGHEEKFFEVHIHFTRTYTGLGSFNGVENSSWELQYFDGNSFGWRTVEEFTDTTVTGNNRTFSKTGVIAWTEEELEDWTKTNHGERADGGANNLYWIRMHPTVNLDDFDLSEVEIYVHTRTNDDLQPILDYAPAGWDLSGATGTAAGSHLQFSGETVLAALNKVAEQSGETFRISNRTRTVAWVGDYSRAGADRAGVTLRKATGEVYPQAVTAYITSLEKLEDSNEIVTRIYPYGAGSGNARLKLTEIPIDPLRPLMEGQTTGDDYEVNYEDNYIENVSATARWGLIEREVQFNEISHLYDDYYGELSADIQLFNAAWTWLKARSEAFADSYRVTVVGLQQYPYPGQVYDLEYLESIDGELRVNITGSYTATKVTQTFSAGQPPQFTLEFTDNPLRRTFVTGQSRMGRLEQAVRYQTRPQRKPHDDIVADVNSRHSRPWVLIETFEDEIDFDNDLSPLARAQYRAGKDLGLWR